MSEVADLAAALVRIDSVNPALMPGAAGEAEIAADVAGRLARAKSSTGGCRRDGGSPSSARGRCTPR